MSFTPSFAIAQNPLYPNLVVAVDDSSGSDGAITQRRIFYQTYSGAYLVPTGTSTSYIQWALADTTLSSNILTQDMSVQVTVQWLDVSNTVLYTLTQYYCLSIYSKQFLYYLVQLQGLTPPIVADTNYSSNLSIVWANILGAINAIELASDLSASQNCLNRIAFMIQNQSLYF